MGARSDLATPRQASGPRRVARPPAPAQPTRAAFLAVFDALLIVAALGLAVTLRFAPFMQPVWVGLGFTRATWAGIPEILPALVLFQIAAVPFAYYALGRYKPTTEGSRLAAFAKDGMIVLLTQYPILVGLYLLRAGTLPRGIIVLDLLFLAALLPGWRAVWTHRERKRLQAGEHLHNVLIVGATPTAQRLAAEIIADPMHGLRLAGFLDDREVSLSELPASVIGRPDVWARRAGDGPIPVNVVPDDELRHRIEGRQDLKTAVTTYVRSQPRHLAAIVGDTSESSISETLDGLCIEQVFLSADVGPEVADRIVRACRARGVDVHFVPTHYPGLETALQPWKFGDFTVVSLYRTPIPPVSWALKRALDIVGGIAGLIAFSPILLASAIAIKMEDPRMQVFYRSPRVGIKGRHFPMLKFTTMRTDAQALEAELKRHNTREGPWFKIDADKDPRLTRVGRVLRKYSINEIPQLWNIVKGEMSLVGPRPPLPDEVASYVEYDFRYYRCLDVKPGLTGLWQVYGRKDPSFDKRIDMDLEYIREWNLLMDLKLIAMTPIVILKDREE